MICETCRNEPICLSKLILIEVNGVVDIPKGIIIGIEKCKLFRKLPEKKPEPEPEIPDILSPDEGCPWCGSHIEIDNPKKRATDPCPQCHKPIHIRDDYTVTKGRVKKQDEKQKPAIIVCPNDHLIDGFWHMAGKECHCSECDTTFKVKPDMLKYTE